MSSEQSEAAFLAFRGVGEEDLDKGINEEEITLKDFDA